MDAITTLKFGPVRPAIELARRNNSQRLEYIAAAGFANDALERHFGKKITSLGCATKLFRAIMDQTTIAQYDKWTTSTKYRCKQLREEALNTRRIQLGLSAQQEESDVLSWMNALLSQFDLLKQEFACSGNKPKLDDGIPGLPVNQQSAANQLLRTIRANIAVMSEFCADRIAFAQGRNLDKETSVTKELIGRLAMANQKTAIQDNIASLDPVPALKMSHARLFSLLNNAVRNPYFPRYNNNYLSINYTKNKPGLMFLLGTEDAGIEESLLQESTHGMARLFELPTHPTHYLATNLAEVCDIVAIQNGAIFVSSQPRKSWALGFWLPAINRAQK